MAASEHGQKHFKVLVANNVRFLKCVWTIWDIVYESVKPFYRSSGATARYPIQVYLCHNNVELLNSKKCMKIWKRIAVSFFPFSAKIF